MFLKKRKGEKKLGCFPANEANVLAAGSPLDTPPISIARISWLTPTLSGSCTAAKAVAVIVGVASSAGTLMV